MKCSIVITEPKSSSLRCELEFIVEMMTSIKADKVDEQNRESTRQSSKRSRDSWNSWRKRSPSEHIMKDYQAHSARIKANLAVA